MINSGLMTWQSWAFLSAVFAALTAIFAKIGVSDINSDMATLIRTVIILCVLALIVLATGQWQELSGITSRDVAVPDALGAGDGSFLGMLFPRAENWRCGARGARRQAQHCIGCGVWCFDSGRTAVGHQLAWRGPVHGGNRSCGDAMKPEMIRVIEFLREARGWRRAGLALTCRHDCRTFHAAA